MCTQMTLLLCPTVDSVPIHSPILRCPGPCLRLGIGYPTTNGIVLPITALKNTPPESPPYHPPPLPDNTSFSRSCKCALILGSILIPFFEPTRISGPGYDITGECSRNSHSTIQDLNMKAS